MLLILITSGKKCAKATSHLRRIHRRSALQGGAKVQGYALCLSPEVHRAGQNFSYDCLTRVRDCRAKAAATAPQRVHGSQCGRGQTAIPRAVSKTTKSRLTHGKESQCARRLKERIARMGGLGNLSPLSNTI